jgi:hypothetical protein
MGNLSIELKILLYQSMAQGRNLEIEMVADLRFDVVFFQNRYSN